MREILFRGKTVNGNEWVIGAGVYKSEGYTWIITDDVTKTENRGTGSDAIIPETVGQYTGITDKNGTKIFEGDVCRNTRTGEIVSVKWHGTMAGFVWSKRKSTHLYDFGELFRAYDKFEVIGNIHDNPELIKEV